ncbi:LysM peptidoglycan-binding domain-containing protein [Roseburia hominis]|uniref:LysM peptidoglycan-binding domain-containing protein n=1 Tax=Roseburia hominis TaxID=301301 RepID=UPI001F158BFD|nr:LysM peptidoglycan-binding domain-containing protein [Roseburia hominis]
MSNTGYDFYFDQMLWPVAPEKFEVKHNGQNKTINLINDGEVNVLKKEGLQESTIEFLLPARQYPFAKYLGGFKPPLWYINYLDMYKRNKQPMNFSMMRFKNLGDINETYFIMRCTLEDYTVKEHAEEGRDMLVECKIKEWKDYCTKLFSINGDGTITPYWQDRDSLERKRNGEKYTVQWGDCLWRIAKMHYGDGGAYQKIMDANGLKGNPNNLIYPGQVLILPV